MKTEPAKKIINCVVQCRVSSLKQSHEGESLETQEKDLRRLAAARGWNIVPNDIVWSTAISGRKTDRDDFMEIIAYIKSHPGFVDNYVFKSIDRATRAGTGEYTSMKNELSKYGVQMVDYNGVIQKSINTLENYGLEYPWSIYSPSEITEGVLATTAKQEVTTILTRLIGQEINLTNQGYHARRPAEGYLNSRIYVDGKKKTIQIPDPERAKFYISMFELRAQGLKDKEIVDRVNAMGYRSLAQNKWNKEHSKIIGQMGGKPLSIKQLQRHIKNTIYAGVICEKWTRFKPIKVQYDGLVNIDLWNQANRGGANLRENLDGSIEFVAIATSKTGEFRNRNNPLFPFKFVLCPKCHQPFCGSEPRNRVGNKIPYYHCSRGHKYFGIPKNTFDNNVKQYISNLKFNPDILNALEATFMAKYRQREAEIVQASGNIHHNIAELEIEQKTKLEALALSKSVVVREKFEQEIDALEVRIIEAGRQCDIIKISRDDIKAFMREAKLIMEHPAETLLNQGDMRVQRELFGLVFEELPNYEEIVNGTPKLSLIFNLSSAFTTNERQLVGLDGIEPFVTLR